MGNLARIHAPRAPPFWVAPYSKDTRKPSFTCFLLLSYKVDWLELH